MEESADAGRAVGGVCAGCAVGAALLAGGVAGGEVEYGAGR